MSYAEFQAEWEQAADEEYRRYLLLVPAELLAAVRGRRYGEYFQLWRAIAARTTVSDAGRLLIDVLRSDEAYLVRYHASAALLTLLADDTFRPADLSANHPDRLARIALVERMVDTRLAEPK